MQQVNERTGRTGRWIGVFGESLTLLVPGEERDRALRWWSLVDDGADVETLLDALLSDGLSSLKEFVVVHVGEQEPDRVRVLVRGGAVVTAWTAEGQVQVKASGRLWVEDDFVRIVAVRVDLPGHDWLAPETREGTSGPFAVQPGLCRVGEVVWGSVPAPRDPELAGPSLSLVGGRAEPEPTSEPAGESDDERAGGSGSEPAGGPDRGPAIRVNVVSAVPPPFLPPVVPTGPGSQESESGSRDAEAPGDEPEPAESPDTETQIPQPRTPDPLTDPLPDDEMETGPLAATPLAPSAEPPAPPASSTDWADSTDTPASTSVPEWQEEVTTHLPPVELSGLTLLGLAGDPEEDEPAPQSSGAPATRWARLRFSHGPSIVLDRPLVIGRAPSARPASADADLVTVPSPQQEISGNHVEIRPGHRGQSGTAVVTDLGSTNGTVVTQPGLGPEELHPGAPVVALPGAVVDLGDGLRIQVEPG